MYMKRGEAKMFQLDGDPVSNEQIRMIRANLEQVVPQARSFVITSPSDEGETTIISAKLAIAFAEQGKKVLIVDADIRTPLLHHSFHLSDKNGLTNVLLNHAELHDLVKETTVPGLFVLPAGPRPGRFSDVWVRGKIKELAGKSASEFDVILFAAPPYLTSSDSHILANECDGVILVLKANKTKKAEALKTRDYLNRSNCQIVGVIYQTG